MALTKQMAHFEVSIGDQDQNGQVDIVADFSVFGFQLVEPKVHNIDAAKAFGFLSSIRGLVSVAKRLIPGL